MCAKVSKVHIKKIETKNKKKIFNKKTLKSDKFKNKVSTKNKANGTKNESKFPKKRNEDEPRIKEIFQYKPKIPFDKEKNRKKILKVLKDGLRMDFGKDSKDEGKEATTDETPKNDETTPVKPPKTEAASPKKKKNKKNPAKEGEKTEDSMKVEAKTTNETATTNTEAESKQPKSFVENTIFVGNVPANTKKVQLMKLFAKCGKVLSVRFRTLDGKKLFKHKTKKEAQALNAYVVLDSAQAVEKAHKLSGTEFKGNHIRVDRAKGKDGRQAELKSIEEEKQKSKRTIFVGNLKYSATDEKLHDIFSSCGEVEYVRTIQSEKGCKGVAYVCFKKPESVLLALELNNTLVDDRPIRVERCSKEKSDKQKEQKAKMNGAPRRLLEKEKKKNVQNKKGKQKPGNKNNAKKSPDDGDKIKAPFKGVKSDKVKKNKKKKKMPEALKLAKKLSPGQKKSKVTPKD